MDAQDTIINNINITVIVVNVIFVKNAKKKKCITSKGAYLSYYMNKETIRILSAYGKDFINAQIKEENETNCKSLQYKELAKLTDRKLTIDNELRSIALKWIYTIITDNNMDINVYYITVSIFDSILV